MAEEIHVEEHSSPIKTPRQLIAVVVASFAVPIALIAMLTQLVTGGTHTAKDNPGLTDEAIAKRLKPVGAVEVIDPNAPRVEKSGKDIVAAVCAACHVTGALNAPKVGDKTAWGKLIKEGQEKITQDAMKGVRQMPPRGGAADLTDTEFARAVAYMANQAGANWKEPESKPMPVKPAAASPAMAPSAAPTPAVAASGSSTQGKSVYDTVCMVCHAAGVAGAPKAGDKSAWAPRVKTGMDALYANALKGKNAMPPKGGNLSLPDADVKAAVDYMVSLVK